MILDNGDLKCWGNDGDGQLGDGGWGGDLNAPPSAAINLGTGRTAVAVSAGHATTCAILDNGELKCWGSDDGGQLGNGGSNTKIGSPPSTAIDLGMGRTAVAVSVGYAHTCAILDNGDLKCWGSNSYGVLGFSSSISSSLSSPPTSAIDLGSGRTAVAVSAGKYHTCAILDNGSMACWGRNNVGQLGDGTTTDRVTPALTNSLGAGRTAVALETGNNGPGGGAGHTCAILDNGDLKCWGSDAGGELGDGGTISALDYLDEPPTAAIDLGSGRTAVAVSAGAEHTCALLDNGEVKCWGKDDSGQLGDGGSFSSNNDGGISAPSSTAIDLGTGRTAVALDSGLSFSCAILDNGDAKCWGHDYYGQLGYGSSGSNARSYSPVSVSGSNTWDTSTGSILGVTGASSCTVSPALPTGLNIDTSTCTISGTPSVATSNTTYNITADISGTTYQGTVWLSSSYPQLTPSVEGAELETGQAMTDITFNAPLPPANGSMVTIFSNSSAPQMKTLRHLDSKIDADGVIHAIYHEPNPQTLIYGKKVNGSWTMETLDSGQDDTSPSIELDSNGNVHMASYNHTTKKLMYSNNIGGAWTHSQVADIGNPWGVVNYPCYTSIDLDSSGYVYIAYMYDCQNYNPEWRLANNSGGSWSVDTLGTVVKHFDLGIDSDDNIHLVYKNQSSTSFEHRVLENGLWSTTVIDSGTFENSRVRFALDSNNTIHAYTTVPGVRNDHRYYNNTGGVWNVVNPGPCFTGQTGGGHPNCGLWFNYN